MIRWLHESQNTLVWLIKININAFLSKTNKQSSRQMWRFNSWIHYGTSCVWLTILNFFWQILSLFAFKTHLLKSKCVYSFFNECVVVLHICILNVSYFQAVHLANITLMHYLLKKVHFAFVDGKNDCDISEHSICVFIYWKKKIICVMNVDFKTRKPYVLFLVGLLLSKSYTIYTAEKKSVQCQRNIAI